jgi:hypothetical protein
MYNEEHGLAMDRVASGGCEFMTISASEAPLTVSTDGTAGPYVIVITEQFRPVMEALRADGIRFRVDDEAVLLNGAQALAIIELQPVRRLLNTLTANPNRAQLIITDLVHVEWVQ